jgi:hypothetical protein
MATEASRQKGKELQSMMQHGATKEYSFEAKRLSRQTQLLYYAWFILLTCSIVFLIAAVIRGEPGYYLILILLICFAAMAGMIA